MCISYISIVTELTADFFTWSDTLMLVAMAVLMVSLQLKGFVETDVSDSKQKQRFL